MSLEYCSTFQIYRNMQVTLKLTGAIPLCSVSTPDADDRRLTFRISRLRLTFSRMRFAWVYQGGVWRGPVLLFSKKLGGKMESKNRATRDVCK